FVNVPLCILAGWMLIRNFHEKVEHRKHRIDYAGAILLTFGMSLLILAVLEGGQAWAWDSVWSIGTFVIGGLLLVAFVLVERKAAEPILPLWVFSRRLLVTTTLVSLGVGAVLIGLTSYVPTYLEGTIHVEPIIAGLAVAALTIGWPIAASLSGRFYLRIGFRNTALVGTAIAIVGAVVLALTASHPSVLFVAVSCFIVGLGMGLIATPTLIAAQSSVAWNERGVVTGTNLFARSIGSSVGVAVFGAIANSIIAGSIGGEQDPATVQAASTAVFVAVAVVAVLTIAAGLAMPRARVEDVEISRQASPAE
ncbi:MAG TPA: MFS transporter, partial [Leifsonia sp.]|nr:MFS transporter [Leifsonia sp.]